MYLLLFFVSYLIFFKQLIKDNIIFLKIIHEVLPDLLKYWYFYNIFLEIFKYKSIVWLFFLSEISKVLYRHVSDI